MKHPVTFTEQTIIRLLLESDQGLQAPTVGEV